MKNIIKCYNIKSIIACLLILHVSISICQASSKPKPLIIVTIDVETVTNRNHSLSISEQYDLEKENIQFGTIEILNILEKYHIKGVFFYNVYEYWKDGNSVRDIVHKIDNRGHDIELHTHPQWAYDPEKLFMHNYTYEKQVKIVSEGKTKLEEWTGKKIIAHRAGAYGADFNTLKALEKNKIFIDSSFYYKHPRCKLNDRKLKKNYISKFNKIIEVPVNVFYLDDVPGVTHNVKPIRHIAKYDINEYVEDEILIKAIDKATELNYDTIVLFLHSYTFIDHNKADLTAQTNNILKFNNIIKYLIKNDYQFITFKEFDQYRLQNNLIFQKKDEIPILIRKINSFKYFAKTIGLTRTSVTYISFISFLLFAIFISIIIRKKFIKKA